MAYKDNVQCLCEELKIHNPIRESDLQIAALVFYDEGNDFMLAVAATDMNRAGRLYVEHLYYPKAMTDLTVSRQKSAEFFTPELWDDCGPDKRTLVYGLKKALLMKLVYK